MQFHGTLQETITDITKVGKKSYGMGCDWLSRYWKSKHNGLHLLRLCSEFNLVICNTFFRQKEKHKVTSIHPRSKHVHMIDFIVTRRDDLKDVCNIHVMQHDTDYKLVRGKFKLWVKIKVWLIGAKILWKAKATHYVPEALRRFSNVTFNFSWENFKDQIYASGMDILKLNEWKPRDWFDESDATIRQLLETKRSLQKSIHKQVASEDVFQGAERKLAMNAEKQVNNGGLIYWLKFKMWLFGITQGDFSAC